MNNISIGNRDVLHKIYRCRALYVLFVPVALYYLLFVYLPMFGLLLAFKDFNFMEGVWGSSWVGFKYFQRFLSNEDFWKVFYNTLIINAYRLFFVFPMPVLFALLLNEVKQIHFKRVVQTISYMPHFISWVITSSLIYSFLSLDNGLVNTVIKTLGFEPVFFLGTPDYFRGLVVASDIWKEIGWNAIIYLAAIAGIDSQIYEASIIDGANRWQQLWHITLPGIRNVISVMFILWSGQIMSMGFEQILVLINGTVMGVGETIDYYVYRIGITQINNYSYATAIGLFKGIIGLVLILATNKLSKLIDEDGGIY